MRTTVCSKFQKQLKDLRTILQASQRKYIRCVKPNDKKRPRLFDCVHSLEQLRYSGIFEAVKIRKEGYPFRYTHQQFVHRYRCLPMTKGISVSSDVRQAIQDVIRSRPECKDRIYVGRSLVLYRAPEHRILELARNLGNRCSAILTLLALDELLPSLQNKIKCKSVMIGLPLYSQVQDVLTVLSFSLVPLTPRKRFRRDR